MWVIFVISVIFSVATSAVGDETHSKRISRGTFSKGEIPLLLIRPVSRPSGSSGGLYRPQASASSKISANDDISMLGSILPQLGLDPSLFSAFSMNGGNQGSKMHIIPVHQNEVKHGQNYKHEYHLKLKETPSYSFSGKHYYSFPSPPTSHSLIQHSHEDRYPSYNTYHTTEKEPQYKHHEYEHETHHEPEFEKHEPLNTYTYHQEPASELHHPAPPPSPPKHETYFAPKPIDFDVIKPTEELVIGKPASSYPAPPAHPPKSKFNDFKIPPKSEGNFYIGKDEQTASFEVKSKTENVKFVPHDTPIIHNWTNEHTIEPKLKNYDDSKFHFNLNYNNNKNQYLPNTQSYSKPHFTLFKQSPIEYFFPREHETATIKMNADTDEYYKNFETDEYFLPKKEPPYHKMAQFQSTTTSSTESPYGTTPHPIFDDSYSFTINDDGYSNIHISDHVYAEPQALRFTSNNDFNTFYPNHKEYDSKLSALDFVKTSIKSNLESSHKNLLSSSYSEKDLNKPDEIKDEKIATTSSYEDKDKEEKDFKETFTFAPIKDFKETFTFAPIKDFKSEFNYNFPKEQSHHSHHHAHNHDFYPHAPTFKDIFSRPTFSLKESDVRPVFEVHHEEFTTASPGYGDYKEYQQLPATLYLNERENSTILDSVTSTSSPLSTKFELKFPTKFTTPKITTYKSKMPLNTSTKSIETTTDSGVNLLSGIACERQCIRNTVSQEYDPVCGSDGKTYSNKGKLRCTRTCGKSDLQVRHYGGCGRSEQAK